MLVVCGLVLVGLSAAYAVTRQLPCRCSSPWSTACSGRGCSPPRPPTSPTSSRKSRRAEGIGYWGLVHRLARSPSLRPWDFGCFATGWFWVCAAAVVLNLVMAGIAWSLPETAGAPRRAPTCSPLGLIEWRVLKTGRHAVPLLVRLRRRSPASRRSTLTRIGVTPKGIYFMALALSSSCRDRSRGRSPTGRARRVLLPSLLLIAVGLVLSAARRRRARASSPPQWSLARVSERLTRHSLPMP